MPIKPNSSDYVCEQMYFAVRSMCGRGPLGERLANATIPFLLVLEEHDLPAGELQEDLKYVLDWTKRNLDDGVAKMIPDDNELNRLIEKMLRILLALKVQMAKSSCPSPSCLWRSWDDL